MTIDSARDDAGIEAEAPKNEEATNLLIVNWLKECIEILDKADREIVAKYPEMFDTTQRG